jgi:AcrR family transcriptional regulator
MSRLKPSDRKEEILAAAVKLARKPGGYSTVTLVDIAKEAGCVHALVLHYFGTVVQMRRAVMSRAILIRDTAILAQGLALGDAKARQAPAELKAKAAEYLTL